MAHVSLSRTIIALAIMFGTGGLLAACDSGTKESQNPSKRISGVTDGKFYVHPRANSIGNLVVKGCCTFNVGSDTVTQLTGDVDGRLVRGDGFRIEIAFGSRLVPIGPEFTPTGRREIDGVVVTDFKSGPRQLAMAATVPLSREVAEQGIDFPQLRVVGQCNTDDACRRLSEVVDSVRF